MRHRKVIYGLTPKTKRLMGVKESDPINKDIDKRYVGDRIDKVLDLMEVDDITYLSPAVIEKQGIIPMEEIADHINSNIYYPDLNDRITKKVKPLIKKAKDQLRTSRAEAHYFVMEAVDALYEIVSDFPNTLLWKVLQSS